jgi:hypothetical protein
MQDWRADSFYEFGDTVSLKSFLYFCLAVKTETHPTEVADWLKINLVCEDLPEKGRWGEVAFLNSSSKCFIFENGWGEICLKKLMPIIFSNRDPEEHDQGVFWINEIENLVFKRSEVWERMNSGDEEIFEYPFPPSSLDDESDSSGNGVITEDSLWIDSQYNKVYVNVDPSYRHSIWKTI